jgi:hypothetical protein
MTTPTEALRTIMPIAGWGDTQAADVDEARIGDGADRVVEDLGKRRVADVFPIVELDAPHQVARVAERRHPPAVDAVAGVADRFRERLPRRVMRKGDRPSPARALFDRSFASLARRRT